jgi:hypothetical protein
MADNAKDVMVTVLVASVALSGLLLVFAGLLFSQAAAFPRDTTDDDVIDRFRRIGRLALWPFLLSLCIAGLCLWWLLCPNESVYLAAWISFAILLSAAGVYGFWVTWRLL